MTVADFSAVLVGGNTHFGEEMHRLANLLS
jgi:hypothetical protein